MPLINFVWLQQQKCAGSGAPRFPTTVTFCHHRERARGRDVDGRRASRRLSYLCAVHALLGFAKEDPHIISVSWRFAFQEKGKTPCQLYLGDLNEGLHLQITSLFVDCLRVTTSKRQQIAIVSKFKAQISIFPFSLFFHVKGSFPPK